MHQILTIPRRWLPLGPVMLSSWRRTSRAKRRPRTSKPASLAHSGEKLCSCHACTHCHLCHLTCCPTFCLHSLILPCLHSLPPLSLDMSHVPLTPWSLNSTMSTLTAICVAENAKCNPQPLNPNPATPRPNATLVSKTCQLALDPKSFKPAMPALHWDFCHWTCST